MRIVSITVCKALAEVFLAADKRAVKSLNPRVDKTINNFQAQFTKIMSSFTNHTILDATVKVYRVMDALESIGVFSALSRIWYLTITIRRKS